MLMIKFLYISEHDVHILFRNTVISGKTLLLYKKCACIALKLSNVPISLTVKDSL